MIEVIHLTYLSTVLVSAIFSLKAFRLNWPLAYKLFSLFLFAALVTEIAGTLWAYNLFGIRNWDPLKTDNNAWLISFMLIPQYLLYIAVYHQILASHKLKNGIKLIVILYTIFAIANLIFGQGIAVINSYTHIAASFVMLFLVFAYFEQIRNNNKLISLKREAIVWISLGNFIYHLVNIPFLLSINYIIKYHPQIMEPFYIFYLLMLIITYALYIKSFLCPHPQQK
jgi:hypothetical protein